MKKVKIIVCYFCKKGGENGPLRKVGKLDYAHEKCSITPPAIENQSFRFEERYTKKELEKMKEDNESKES